MQTFLKGLKYNTHDYHTLQDDATATNMQTEDRLQVAVGGCGTHSHVVCTVTGLAGTGSSRKLIGLSGANGMAGWGLRVTWAAGEAERRKQSITYSHTHTHLFQGHMTGIQTENNNQARCTHTRWVKVKEASKSVQKHCKGKRANKRESETQNCNANMCKRSVTALSGKI